MNYFDIYTSPGCQPCRQTKKLLNELDHSPYEIDASENLTEFELRGHNKTAPLVVVFDDNGVELDSWTGYRPDKIKEYA